MIKSLSQICFFLLLYSSLVGCNQIGQKEIQTKTKEAVQDSLIEQYLTNCATQFNYRFQMQEWQDCLDRGLEEDSTVAYFWQQKAMPYFKARKYEVGMKYLDKAVLNKPERWLSYRAFIKCIFSKQYKEALVDFEKCVEMEGNSYEMDHTYNFHIALCHLQLNHFKKAEKIFKKDILEQEEQWGEAHFLDIFYYGMSLYEQEKWEEAIRQFDKALEQYPTFSDVKYYKAFAVRRLGKMNEFKTLLFEAKKDAENGNTFNEANSIYEPYPYQIVW